VHPHGGWLIYFDFMKKTYFEPKTECEFVNTARLMQDVPASFEGSTDPKPGFGSAPRKRLF